MKRIFPVLVLMLVAGGCVTVPNSVVSPAVSARPSDRVTLGMTRAMVASIMDARVTVAYGVDPDTKVARSTEVQNLYSSEIVKINEGTYQVDRYIVHSPVTGGHVIEAELFPVVYRSGLVVATGREGLAALAAPVGISTTVPVKAVK